MATARLAAIVRKAPGIAVVILLVSTIDLPQCRTESAVPETFFF